MSSDCGNPRNPSRRDVVGSAAKAAVTAGAAGCGLAALCRCGSSSGSGGSKSGGAPTSTLTPDASGNATLAFSDYPNLQNAGGYYRVTIGSTVVSIVRVSSSQVSAVSTICTHQGCTLNDFANSQYYCACHGSTFSVSGTVTGGPASSSLTSYPAQITASGIQVTV